MASIVSQTPRKRAAQEHHPRVSGISTENQNPLTVIQAKVVCTLLPLHRTLALEPPHSGTIRLAQTVLKVTHQTFKRLQELGALVLTTVRLKLPSARCISCGMWRGRCGTNTVALRRSRGPIQSLMSDGCGNNSETD